MFTLGYLSLFATGVFATIIFAAGCGVRTEDSSLTESVPGSPIESPAIGANASKDAADGEHGHVPGAHGGIIVPIGSDSYHAEAVIEKDGVFRLLTLGADETRMQEVDVQPIKAYVKVTGDADATPIDLVATPQDGDAEGKTSQFVGQLPEALIGKSIDVTIPNLRIESERFRVGFTTASAEHNSDMPAAVSDDEERELYFTAAGKYTAEDIKANGSLPASQTFKGVMSAHDMKPKPGDLICPVTLTKANPKFTWIVDGKPYQFCCPPCVDEFIRLAKEEPEEIKAPEDYVKK